MAKIIGNTTATPGPIGNLSNLKTKNKNSLVDAINEAAESANGDFVSYSQSQDLTNEQKEIARNNIDATGIYVGSGDMPEGYDIQIDLNGDTYVMVNKITDETSNEIPNCLAVKNYVADNVTIIDDNNGNITLNTSSKKVEFTDDGNGNIKMEVM